MKHSPLKGESNKPMPKLKCCITYETITPKSAKQGDWEAHGWYLPGGWCHALDDADGRHESVLDAARAGEFDMCLREAFAEAYSLGCVEAQHVGNTITVRSVDADCGDYSTNEGTFYTLHINGGSLGTMSRIRQLLEENGVRFY